MQIKTTIRYHFIPIRMAFIKNKQKKLKTRVGKDVEKLEPFCIAHGNIKWYGHCGKQCLFLKKLNISGLPWWRTCIGIHLPMQGPQVWSLVCEDSTYHGATKLIHHNYWAHVLEPTSCYYWARAPQLSEAYTLSGPWATTNEPLVLQLLKPIRLEPVLCNRRSNKKPVHCN